MWINCLKLIHTNRVWAFGCIVPAALNGKVTITEIAKCEYIGQTDVASLHIDALLFECLKRA